MRGVIPEAIGLNVVRHYAGEVELSGETLVIQTPPEQWNYAVALPVRHEILEKAGCARSPARIELEVIVHAGRLGIGCANKSGSGFLDQTMLEPAAEPKLIELTVHDISQCSALVLRNDWNQNKPTLASVLSVKISCQENSQEDVLFAFYDLNWMPASFDFASFLMDAEIARVKAGLARIHVVVIPGNLDNNKLVNDDQEAAVDQFSRRWRLHNLLLPLLPFYPSVSGFAVAEPRLEAMRMLASCKHAYPVREELGVKDIAAIFQSLMLNLASCDGCLRPEAPFQGKRYVRHWMDRHLGQGRLPIAITLRDAGYSPERNSNIEVWGEFARGLDSTRYAPFFIPDTDTAFLGPPQALAGFPWFSDASFNLGLRFAANEMAYLNLLTSGGASTLCSYSKSVRYLYLKQVVAEAAEASEAYLRRLGHTPGQNVPFAGPFQKWIWQDDTLEVIESEFHAMVALIGPP